MDAEPLIAVAPAVAVGFAAVAPLGVAQVPSPRQNVVLEAEVPELRFVVGRFPVTSVVRLTALKLGLPLALPWSRVVVVPELPSAPTVAVELG